MRLMLTFEVYFSVASSELDVFPESSRDGRRVKDLSSLDRRGVLSTSTTPAFVFDVVKNQKFSKQTRKDKQNAYLCGPLHHRRRSR